ncbi:MAG TPA: class A beta-lactamase-related serine hydrolase [Pseudobdellovibrionaceae bacterium]|nr:class A beta-lactamase-related serine hydrolase [Pseudobdellovibrionaceae bacterium]
MKAFSIALSFVVGVAVSSAFFLMKETSSPPEEPRELQEGQTDLINPLLDCPAASSALPPKHAEIEEAVLAIIAGAKARGEIGSASVYFRDLNNGPAFGIEARATFSTASLLKVPVMIGYFKKLETEPDLFNQTIVYHANQHEIPEVSQTIEPPDRLQEGKAYPIDHLISRMIVLSDNTAASMLLTHRPDIDVVSTLKDMGVILNVTGDDATLSVNAYASIFRILYNATYLNRVFSKGALQLLTQSHMSAALVAGVEPGLMVAHKFGERSQGGQFQFHDCGIVYAPERPYLLCVMTRGQKNMDPLIQTVAKISKVVFDKMKNP